MSIVSISWKITQTILDAVATCFLAYAAYVFARAAWGIDPQPQYFFGLWT